ncbi:hypothetical protein VP01_1159g5 [Puccinia sorghi]|uniref:Nucleoporin Nup82 n=1 Tax=Puccinia sorghi TaxID=27349 RepID=A0A0L6VRK0_9BASI|nr:hypothetical protein VP01_1159g5 [Puccinia sorghi]
MAEETDDYLNTLPNHPIFNSNHNHNIFTIISNNHLILSAPPELRLISLVNYKANDQQQQQPKHKLIIPLPSSAIPRKPILCLLPNPNSRLLALSSTDQVSVLSLPRSEEISDSSTQIQCQTIPIGLNHQHLGTIAKLLWHPWSYRASTLLILYTSGILLEYDVSCDALNPTQIIDFNSPHSLRPTSNRKIDLYEGHPSIISSFQQASLNSHSRHSSPLANDEAQKSNPRLSSSLGPSKHLLCASRSGTYGPTDRDSSTAVSICFGTGVGDWGPLTLYVVMLNGDLYAICPYLPKNAVLPLSYRNSLLFFLTAKLESISQSGATGSMLLDLQGPLNRSLDYLNSLSDVPDLPLDDEDLEAVENHQEGIRNNRKDRFMDAVRPLRQGPFLMTPSPIETNENEEETVSALLHFRYSPSLSSVPPSQKHTGNLSTALNPSSDPNNDGVGVFMIAYQSRIDVCLEVEKIEPRWASSSEVEEQHEKARVTGELPMLVTYESIDLGLNTSPNERQDSEDSDGLSNGLNLVPDARYLDTIYVSHRFGIHVVSTLAWIESLARGSVRRTGETSPSDGGDEARMLRTIQEKIGSQVAWVIQTAANASRSRNPIPSVPTPPRITSLSVVDDAYLGYSLMALTDDGQLVAVPLKHRPIGPIPDVEGKRHRSMIAGGGSLQAMSAPGILGRSRGPHNGMLGEERWAVPELLRKEARAERRLSAPPKGASSSASASLRYAHQVSTQIDHYIRQLVEAVNAGQDRLKLQITQFQGQIHQLARYPGRLEALDFHLETQSRRLHAVYSKHKMLLKRADLVLQKLADDRNRDLSREEIKWFAELNRMALEVRGDGPERPGLGAQIDLLKGQLEATKERLRLSSEGSSKSGTGGLGRGKLVEDQISKINSALAAPL